MDINKRIKKLNDKERLNLIDVKKIIDEFELHGAMDIVDFGTGTGLFALEFLKHLPDANCVGLDISEEIVNWVKNNVVEKEKRYKIKLIDGQKIPFEDHSKDFVFMITALHELEKPIEVLNEIFRILNDKGQLMLADWKEGSNIKHKDKLYSKEQIREYLKINNYSKIEEYNKNKDLYIFFATK